MGADHRIFGDSMASMEFLHLSTRSNVRHDEFSSFPLWRNDSHIDGTKSTCNVVNAVRPSLLPPVTYLLPPRERALILGASPELTRNKHLTSNCRCIAILALLVISAATASEADDSWRHYGADAGGKRFSPHTQINPGNVATLRRAWVYRTGDTSDGKRYPGTSTFKATLPGIDLVLEKMVGVRGFRPPTPASRRHFGIFK